MRFGNVLGSSGSVIPIFRRQIERGGPVTVTNPEMTRFFMTIPRRRRSSIQAGAMGGSGQVYVLDMGEPVKILDLARQMIELSGTHRGPRSRSSSSARAPARRCTRSSGTTARTVGPTSHPKIMRAARAPIDPEWLEDELAELERLVAENDMLGVAAKLPRWCATPQRARGPSRCSKTRSH